MATYGITIYLSDIQFPHQQPLPSWGEVRRFLASFRVLCFLYTMFVMGMGLMVIGSFLFLYLEEIGGNEFLMGLSLVRADSSSPSPLSPSSSSFLSLFFLYIIFFPSCN